MENFQVTRISYSLNSRFYGKGIKTAVEVNKQNIRRIKDQDLTDLFTITSFTLLKS